MNDETRKENEMTKHTLANLVRVEQEGIAIAVVKAINERKEFNHSEERLFLQLEDGPSPNGRIAFGTVTNGICLHSWALGPTYRAMVHVNDWLDAYAEAQKETWKEARCWFEKSVLVEPLQKVLIKNYAPPMPSKRKWDTVLVFATEPRDSPRMSKEGKELAKFTARGDSWNYAKALSAKPGTHADAWAIVIR